MIDLSDDESTMSQIFEVVTDRTGILAVANMPMVWLFASRNNVFLWLTGWNFASYNYFHRWVSRIVTLEAIVHSIGYTWIELQCQFFLLSLTVAIHRLIIFYRWRASEPCSNI